MKHLSEYINEALRSVFQYEGLEITRKTLEEILNTCGYTLDNISDKQALQVVKEAQKVFTSNSAYEYKDACGNLCKTTAETALQVYINSYDADKNPSNPDIINVVSKDIIAAFTAAAQKFNLSVK